METLQVVWCVGTGQLPQLLLYSLDKELLDTSSVYYADYDLHKLDCFKLTARKYAVYHSTMPDELIMYL